MALTFFQNLPARRSCRTDRIACDQTGDPSRAESVTPETAPSSAELRHSICKLADPAAEF